MDTPLTFTDLIRNLTDLNIDPATVAYIVDYLARDRWNTQRLAVTGSEVSPLAFAARLDEHIDRAHGVCVTMIGLRETLGGETSVCGAHQLTIDLADSALRLKRDYDGLLLRFDSPPRREP